MSRWGVSRKTKEMRSAWNMGGPMPVSKRDKRKRDKRKRDKRKRDKRKRDKRKRDKRKS